MWDMQLLSPSSSTIMSGGIANAELNNFFEDIYHRLTQALRMMIYYELLTESMMHKIAACASPPAYAHPLNHVIFKYEPALRFLKPRILDSLFCVDILKAFYCKYSGFEVKHPLRIVTLLQRDFFKLRPTIKLANYPLRALTVDGSLLSDNKHYIDLKLLPVHFAPLFRTQQRLAPDFHLIIRLWIDTSSRKSAKENSAQGVALRRTLQALKPLSAELIEKEPRSTHSVVLEVARMQKVPLDMALAEESSQSLAEAIYGWCFLTPTSTFQGGFEGRE